MNDRENLLRTYRRTGPEWIPFSCNLPWPLWEALGDELDAVVARHPVLFPNHEPGTWRRRKEKVPPYRIAGREYTDMWGCTWKTEHDGMTGVVVDSPLAEGWRLLDDYTPPDPHTQLTWGRIDWDERRRAVAAQKEAGRFTTGSSDHGFCFMRLYYLRGFENLMVDMAEEAPELQRLIDIIVRHYRFVTEQYAAMGVDMMACGEDLGTQTASMTGPRHFRRWIAPAYRRIFAPAREAGALVRMHSDGFIMDIMDDLLATGIDVINPQDLVNGVDALAREVKGRVSIQLDIDRQRIVVFGTPREIEEHIEHCVRTLGAPEGGLSLVCAIYPPTPPANVEALLSAVEKYRTFWAGKG